MCLSEPFMLTYDFSKIISISPHCTEIFFFYSIIHTHVFLHTQLCWCFLLKCVLEQEKAEKGLAVVKHRDAEPKAYKQTLNLLFLLS